MLNIILLRLLIILCFSPFFLKGMEIECREVKTTPEEDELQKAPIETKIKLYLQWLGEALVQNNSDGEGTLSYAYHLFNEENINFLCKESLLSPLVFLGYDCNALNFGLFKLGGKFSESDFYYNFLAESTLNLSETKVCLQGAFPQGVRWSDVRGYIGDKKVFIKSSKVPLPEYRSIEPTEKTEYWQKALCPTIWFGAFQKGSTWSIKECKASITTVLLCFKALSVDKKVKMPRVIKENHIIPEMCKDFLNAIKDRFHQVYDNMLKQIDHFYTIKDLDPESEHYGKLIVEVVDEEQRSFFKNFKEWYSLKAEKLLVQRFKIIKSLILDHNRTIDEQTMAPKAENKEQEADTFARLAEKK